MERPDLWDTLEMVRADPGSQSYVYANKLRDSGHKGCNTAQVRKRLLRLQKIGKVRAEYRPGIVPPYWFPT